MGHRGVMVGFTTMKNMISVSLGAKMSNFPLSSFTATPVKKDLETLAHLIQSGLVKVHIDKTYSYRQIPEAIGYIESMRTRGKVVMVWDDDL